MRKTAVIFLLLIGVACSKDPPVFQLTNLNNNQISCFGHAGMGFYSLFPPNSWPGLETCLNKGADGSEMDVSMTKDSVLVICHTNDLSATTACSGYISQSNWDDIKNCTIQSNLLKNTTIISLEDFITKLDNPYRYTFTWDTKLAAFNQLYYGVFSRAILNLVHKYQLAQHVFIENPFSDFLERIQQQDSTLNLFLLPEAFNEGFTKAKNSRLFGISINNKNINATQVKQAHDAGLHVTIYGVKTEQENYEAIEKCPDFIQTDNLDYLLKVFGKYHKGYGIWNYK